MDAKVSVSLLIEKLQDFLRGQAATSNPMFKKQVQTTINNLHSFEQFLQDAEDREALSGCWSMNDQTVARVLKAIYSADDATDTLLIRNELQQIRFRRGENQTSPFMFSFTSLFSHTLFIHEMKKFMNEVRRLEKKKEKAVTRDNATTSRLLSFENDHEYGWRWLFLEETDYFVGPEQKMNELFIRLKPHDFPKVIAVVGEGGLGKTTLLKTLYNRVDVMRNFTNRAWVQVQSLSDARYVLADILRQINQVELVVEPTLSEDELMVRIGELLNGGRCLIVLEGVDVESSQILAPLLNSSQFDARIIITTRIVLNLPHQATYLTLRLGQLNEEQSWKLFLNKVRMAEADYMMNGSQLITFKKQILKICGGLPSAIVLLAGLLSTKRQHYDDWYRVIVRATEAVGFFHKSCVSTDKQSELAAVRRLATHSGIINNFPSTFLQNLRSFVAFNTQRHAGDVGMFLNKIISNRGFGLLYMLDLEGLYKPMLSDDVLRKLIHLKYLGLRSTFIDSLPDAVSSLPCLETLDLKHTNISNVIHIDKAEKLRHLYLFENSSDKVRLDLRSPLTNLRTLCGANIESLSELTELQKLTRLRKLKLTVPGNVIGSKEMAECISKLTNLQYLKLRSKDSSYISLDLSLKQHESLQDLYLLGLLSQERFDNLFPPYLRKLTLLSSRINVNDQLLVLGQLPHLNILRLFCDSYFGKQLIFPSEAFPNLLILKLRSLPNLEEWIVEEGAMKYLNSLEIRDCKHLKQPQGLVNLKFLKELVIKNMTMGFGEAVEEILRGRNVYQSSIELEGDVSHIELKGVQMRNHKIIISTPSQVRCKTEQGKESFGSSKFATKLAFQIAEAKKSNSALTKEKSYSSLTSPPNAKDILLRKKARGQNRAQNEHQTTNKKPIADAGPKPQLPKQHDQSRQKTQAETKTQESPHTIKSPAIFEPILATQLTELYEKYKDKGFEVLAFPCNQFLKQEPGSSKDAEEFVCTRYKAEYPIFQKVFVCVIKGKTVLEV
ncbi:hypothetical protein LWI28_016898 [Acer negundo]|uniref:Uncharacterized protein n=1 Tax=Acer negundo TaxID=4023 RepID=A0AAD5IFF4_ACENE|nr:hypothetical protein LWI28_016898 [Acer negundo]